MTLQLVCASANPDKVAEIRAILGGQVELMPRPADVGEIIEDADTLVGNARLKATAICAASGRAAVADDTGLEVDALDGAPGVFSARYAGPGCSPADNRAKLLDALANTRQRTARFRTMVVVAAPNGDEQIAEGVCEGTIADAERGDHGFGYDSIFVPLDGDGRTFAEMSDDEKHRISHRGRAFANLLQVLSDDTSPGANLDTITPT